MLKLSMHIDDYFTIGGNIIVQLSKISGGRAVMSVDAAKEIPIVRGKVIERQGMPRPDCLTTPPSRRVAKHSKDMLFHWNDERERAVQAIYSMCEKLKSEGSDNEADYLRKQIEHIVPVVWESENGLERVN